MKFRDEKKRKVTPNVDLTPLIDVVFQLLIFFMLSATFVVQSSIEIEIPTAQGATQLEQKDLSITLAYGPGGPDDKGPVYVDKVEIFEMEELSRILSEKVAEQPDIRVLIRPDERAPSGRLVEVLGIATSVGVQNYGVLGEPPKVQ